MWKGVKREKRNEGKGKGGEDSAGYCENKGRKIKAKETKRTKPKEMKTEGVKQKEMEGKEE